jgi:hypothetical protein
MTKRALVAAAGVMVGAALLPLRPAQAQWAGCSPSALMVCTAFNASTAYVGGGWHLYLHVWNLYDGTDANGLSHVVTFAGIGSSWTGTASLVSATFNGSAVNWATDNSPNNNVVGAQIDVGAVSKQGATQGLVGCTQGTPPGQYQTCYPNGPELDLDFSTSSQFVLADAVYGWHSQAIDGTGCSLWADSNGHTTNDAGADCSGVVPEPMTMSLLATGLFGMGGVGFIRRRRHGAEGDGRAV